MALDYAKVPDAEKIVPLPEFDGVRIEGSPVALLVALAAARADFEVAEFNKDGQSGNQRFKYANLAAFHDATRKALKTHGVSLAFFPHGGAYYGWRVDYVLAGHEAAIWGTVWAPPLELKEIKDSGSILSHHERYVFQAVMGIRGDEPDPEENANLPAPGAAQQARRSATPPPRPQGNGQQRAPQGQQQGQQSQGQQRPSERPPEQRRQPDDHRSEADRAESARAMKAAADAAAQAQANERKRREDAAIKAAQEETARAAAAEAAAQREADAAAALAEAEAADAAQATPPDGDPLPPDPLGEGPAQEEAPPEAPPAKKPSPEDPDQPLSAERKARIKAIFTGWGLNQKSTYSRAVDYSQRVLGTHLLLAKEGGGVRYNPDVTNEMADRLIEFMAKNPKK